jgi:hypothetical protein
MVAPLEIWELENAFTGKKFIGLERIERGKGAGLNFCFSPSYTDTPL